MKKTKIIIPALGILLLSTAASVTGTVAWFSMNEKVTATKMSIKAKGEAGIAIAAYTGENQGTAPVASAFSDTADATAQSLENMRPTWTNDGDKWYHAKSTNSNSAAASAQYGYEDVSSAKDIYLWNKFAIKATGAPTNVYVTSIEVSGSQGTGFDNCIRVLVRAGDKKLVFAPVSHSTATETLSANLYVAVEGDDGHPDDAVTQDQTVTLKAIDTADALVFTSLGSTAQPVEIFMFYDGEDANCTSDLIPATWVANALSVNFSNSYTGA